MDNLKNSVYLLTSRNDEYRQLLSKKRPDISFTEDKSRAAIVLADPPLAAAHLDEFPKLEWMQSTYAGVDTLTQPGLRTDYMLTNVKGIFGQLISEYVLGYLISHYRHFNLYRQQQNVAHWEYYQYESIAGKTMVILGTGNIGLYLAEVATGMGMKVIGVNRSGIPPKSNVFEKIYHINEMTSALSEADALVCTLPNTPETENILNMQVFESCRQVVLFNVGRGNSLDEDDLLTAIEHGYVQHAFLDVFKQEPLPDTHLFWSHPKITVTPHIAAMSFPDQVAEIFVRNWQSWVRHDLLEFQIDFSKGY